MNNEKKREWFLWKSKYKNEDQGLDILIIRGDVNDVMNNEDVLHSFDKLERNNFALWYGTFQLEFFLALLKFY